MEEQTFKLNIYDNRLSHNLYKCQDDEKYCRAMISKLVFYDRDEVLQMHSDSLMNRDMKYDITKLTPKPFLSKNEKVERVVALESHWLAVFFYDKATKSIISDKVMYISPDGDGYFSSEVDSALKGYVPEEVYFKYFYDYPNNLFDFDKRYYDGTHDEFLKKVNDISRDRITKIFAEIMGIPDIKLEDIYPIILQGFKNKDDKEKFEEVKFLDFMYSQFRIDRIVEFDKKYAEKQSDGQPENK